MGTWGGGRDARFQAATVRRERLVCLQTALSISNRAREAHPRASAEPKPWHLSQAANKSKVHPDRGAEKGRVGVGHATGKHARMPRHPRAADQDDHSQVVRSGWAAWAEPRAGVAGGPHSAFRTPERSDLALDCLARLSGFVTRTCDISVQYKY